MENSKGKTKTEENKRGDFKNPKDVLNTMIQFTGVSCSVDLVGFLHARGADHENYYHYTSLDSLVAILESRRFRLAHGECVRLNDQYEKDFSGRPDVWSRFYMGSFSYGAEERVAMWGLYGMPRELAVRICIPKEAMQYWLNCLGVRCRLQGDAKEEHFGKLKEQGWEFSITDLVYARFRGVITPEFARHDFKKRKLYSARWYSSRYCYELLDYTPLESFLRDKNEYSDLQKAEYTGRIKEQTWEYEQEVRLCLDDGSKDAKENKARGYCDIPVPNEVLRSMRFLWGPGVDSEKMKVIEEKIFNVLKSMPFKATEKTATWCQKVSREELFLQSCWGNGKLKYRHDNLPNAVMHGINVAGGLTWLRTQWICRKIKRLEGRLEKINVNK